LSAGDGLAVADGWSLAGWLTAVGPFIPICGLALAIFGICIRIIGPHFQSAMRDDAARARLIEKLTSRRIRDLYHDYLGSTLDWLDRTISPPPFGRGNPRGRRAFGIKSLNLCVFLSIAYSFASFLIGWVAGSQGVFGQVTFLEDPYWAPAAWPSWLPRGIVALVFLAPAIFWWWWFRKLPGWSEPSGSWVWSRFDSLGRRVFGSAGDTVLDFLGNFGAGAGAGAVAGAVALAGAGAGALAGALAGAGALVGALAGALAVAVAGALAGALALGRAVAVAVAVAGAGALAGAGVRLGADPKPGLVMIMFLVALPWLNGLLDWISLSVSRWLGRGIVAEWDSPLRLAITLFLAVLDLVLAVVFAFIVAWLLAFGVEASARLFHLSLGLEEYVRDAAAAPWTTGFWATFMVLSTLIPTAVHLVLACGAVLVAWPSNPLRRLAAARLESGTQADWLLPQLYLTFGWLLPSFAVPVALLTGLAIAFQLIWFDSLPEALRDTALSGIAAARSLW
jgi:hypothetical protein